MLDPEEDVEAATVIEFFARMNAEGVEYAILRNYESFPKFGHDIDLTVRWDHLSKWKTIAKSCAVDHEWTALTECNHWARSSSREHCAQTLRFYMMPSEEYLEFDAFHSLLILGLPFADEDFLLHDRVWDNRGFYRINERVENLFRLLQIASLCNKSGAEEKLMRYRDRVLLFWDKVADLSAFAASTGLSDIAASLDYLRSGDFQSFRKEIDRQKRAWWIRWISARPLRGIKITFDRFADYLRLFWLSPCGFRVRVFAGDEGQRRQLEQIMKQFRSTNFIHAFAASRNMRERQWVLERGGIVVDWVAEERAEVIMGPGTDQEAAIAKLLTLIVDRHPRILDRRASPK